MNSYNRSMILALVTLGIAAMAAVKLVNVAYAKDKDKDKFKPIPLAHVRAIVCPETPYKHGVYDNCWVYIQDFLPVNPKLKGY